MRYFLDTEFIENGTTIDLISIGIVCEDGRKYYAVNKECNFAKANNWVLDNVLRPMGLDRGGLTIEPLTIEIPVSGLAMANGRLKSGGLTSALRETLKAAKTRREIREELLMFFAPESISSDTKQATKSAEECYSEVEVWTYYGAYDWVVFCWLFGAMIDLPVGFPMHSMDIKQECKRLGDPKLPIQNKDEHNALADALWNLQAWEFLRQVEREQLERQRNEQTVSIFTFFVRLWDAVWAAKKQ